MPINSVLIWTYSTCNMECVRDINIASMQETFTCKWPCVVFQGACFLLSRFLSRCRAPTSKLAYKLYIAYMCVHTCIFTVSHFQVYYHLGAYDDSLTYALGAGDLFDVNGHSEYVETIIGKVIMHVHYAGNYCQYLYLHVNVLK